ncbi:hypothetical protein V5F63_25685 [Xanthobacter autotrophicus DSM 597]|uniref:hypothetical protein n=1 Tax=Xanthobacter wiegelii TaxID=3119913 RepID=UPI00372A9F85
MLRLSSAAEWVKVLPAILVAMAMLFAPIASAYSAPCHDEDSAYAAAADHPHQIASPDPADHHSDESTQTADHGKCCSVSYSVYVPVADGADLHVLDLVFVRQPFDLANQAGDGLAVLPGLDPPRFQS